MIVSVEEAYAVEPVAGAYAAEPVAGAYSHTTTNNHIQISSLLIIKVHGGWNAYGIYM